jgi:hypothetical protein
VLGLGVKLGNLVKSAAAMHIASKLRRFSTRAIGVHLFCNREQALRSITQGPRRPRSLRRPGGCQGGTEHAPSQFLQLV